MIYLKQKKSLQMVEIGRAIGLSCETNASQPDEQSTTQSESNTHRVTHPSSHEFQPARQSPQTEIVSNESSGLSRKRACPAEQKLIITQASVQTLSLIHI